MKKLFCLVFILFGVSANAFAAGGCADDSDCPPGSLCTRTHNDFWTCEPDRGVTISKGGGGDWEGISYEESDVIVERSDLGAHVELLNNLSTDSYLAGKIEISGLHISDSSKWHSLRFSSDYFLLKKINLFEIAKVLVPLPQTMSVKRIENVIIKRGSNSYSEIPEGTTATNVSYEFFLNIPGLGKTKFTAYDQTVYFPPLSP